MVHHSAAKPPPNPGSWIFSQQWVAWMYDPQLRQQLPPVYRLFARYCALNQRYTGQDHIRLGRHLFKGMIWLRQRLALPYATRLDFADGTVLYVNLEDPRFIRAVNEIMNPQEDTFRLGQWLQPGDTFIDVGANHGTYAIKAAQAIGSNGQIMAIEPQPRLAALVRQSLEVNALCPYTVYEVACGRSSGEATFYVPTDSSGAAGLFSRHSSTHGFTAFTVKTQRFDDLVDWQTLPGEIFLKLDIEGGEYDFLEGAETMIATRHPRILMELNAKSLTAASINETTMVERLRSLGYQRCVDLAEPDLILDLSTLHSSRARNVLLLPAE
jgi:FkbM family methyltransferase